MKRILSCAEFALPEPLRFMSSDEGSDMADAGRDKRTRETAQLE